MILWESIIAERQRPLNTLRIEDPVERNVRHQKLKYCRKYDSTPERKAQHKAYAQSEAGKKSDLERHRRYRATPHGREMVRLKALRFYERHKNDPEFKAKKYGYGVIFRARQRAMRLNGEHTLWLMGGVVKVNMGRAA